MHMRMRRGCTRLIDVKDTQVRGARNHLRHGPCSTHGASTPPRGLRYLTSPSRASPLGAGDVAAALHLRVLRPPGQHDTQRRTRNGGSKTNRVGITCLIPPACLRVHPMGRSCRQAHELELTPTHGLLHASRQVYSDCQLAESNRVVASRSIRHPRVQFFISFFFSSIIVSSGTRGSSWPFDLSNSALPHSGLAGCLAAAQASAQARGTRSPGDLPIFPFVWPRYAPGSLPPPLFRSCPSAFLRPAPFSALCLPSPPCPPRETEFRPLPPFIFVLRPCPRFATFLCPPEGGALLCRPNARRCSWTPGPPPDA